MPVPAQQLTYPSHEFAQACITLRNADFAYLQRAYTDTIKTIITDISNLLTELTPTTDVKEAAAKFNALKLEPPVLVYSADDLKQFSDMTDDLYTELRCSWSRVIDYIITAANCISLSWCDFNYDGSNIVWTFESIYTVYAEPCGTFNFGKYDVVIPPYGLFPSSDLPIKYYNHGDHTKFDHPAKDFICNSSTDYKIRNLLAYHLYELFIYFHTKCFNRSINSGYSLDWEPYRVRD
jgi:hypothetical protein